MYPKINTSSWTISFSKFKGKKTITINCKFRGECENISFPSSLSQFISIKENKEKYTTAQMIAIINIFQQNYVLKRE